MTVNDRLDHLKTRRVFERVCISQTNCRMQKEDLIGYIQHTARMCLRRQTRGHGEEYIYWQIMDLFLCHNGKVAMAQAAPILYTSYNLLRKKKLTVRESEKLKAWCIPLAELLCSSVPDHQHRDAVIKMGDDLAVRGCTYGAHICYVVAKVDLGTRKHFELIGCNSTRFPFGLSAMTPTVERTEVYEYVLSLTSGRAQPHFQMIKLCHANRLALLDFSDEAFAYCENIARAVITFPCSIKLTFFTRLIRLSDHVQKGQKPPAWLLELYRLRDKVAAIRANANPEHHSLTTSSTLESQDSKNVSSNLHCPDYRSPDLQCHDLDPEAAFESRYTKRRLLDRKAFTCVYAGIRKTDKKEVVIKLVRKHPHLLSMLIPGTTCEAPVEVVLMQIVSEPPCCSNIVQLLEWFDMADHIVIVLEKPSPSLNLLEFVKCQGGRLTEAQARDIVLQVIQAAQHCSDRGVLHGDIKAENLIISTDTMQVKLTNFGCGALLTDVPYREYRGSLEISPPELEIDGVYTGIPFTIWCLGVLLFSMVCGELPFQSMTRIETEHLKLCPGVSQDPDFRPSFQDIISHEWFTETLSPVLQEQ
ncbi:Serine/threonine-protein kinase pim-1 [Bagarius yarrelli]|uniref:non-specific serine/threonine protein kinase n=1 Tax=Bagarius yarrelli TaxID=175774 RepID=A0A556TVZ9_BAGYA|nr:Serine/threonine-protein kinase pim-1 [Bagarius yarrelli]